MKKEEIKDFKIDDTDNIIALAVFGSYNTENWLENRSDIDILILLKEKRGVEFEFKLEDELLSKLEDFFSYNNMHITFLYLNEFDSDLAKCYIESKNKIILDFNKEIDFRLYVNKYLRNNEWLNKLIRHDTELLNGGK
ncbi:nucleotidyltransferase domain-containing protein [Clostridium uliginosum]|uniref:Nucleotidyltransferase domain-containing protein n=1 Tax=Clostridium uliginosum TaxID=119641 RepID=A0A1I1QWY7_9CLOT|nr:nucleotidyltransferase domain-containing protein [Clostridium uliginosum]SFD26641.1 Nucleotidyltransferase domain-containing protein [Clostridium uliginosum]